MNQPFFSIIIPCYNYGHFLERAINSIKYQDFPNWEILIIDDGSTDNSAQVAKRHAAESNNINYQFQSNSGPATARNLGISQCQGKYIIFLDADDTLAPEALTTVNKIFSTNKNIECLIGAHATIHSNGTTKISPAPILPENPEKRLLFYLEKKIGVCNGAMVIARKVFETIQFPEELRSCEDIPFFAKILFHKRCLSTDTVLAYIYKHSDSLRHNHLEAEKFRVKAVEKIFSDDLPNALQKTKKKHISNGYLSLFRSQYLAHKYQIGRSTYLNAISMYPLHLLKTAYLSKFIKSFIKKHN